MAETRSRRRFAVQARTTGHGVTRSWFVTATDPDAARDRALAREDVIEVLDVVGLDDYLGWSP